MSKQEKKHPLDKMYNKLQDAVAIAEKMTKEVKDRKKPDLTELADELKHIRYLQEVWIGNVNHYAGELENAIISAITDEGRKAA